VQPAQGVVPAGNTAPYSATLFTFGYLAWAQGIVATPGLAGLVLGGGETRD